MTHSTDLVGRLEAPRVGTPESLASCLDDLCQEAATEIKRLTKERDDAASYLRGVLISFVNEHCDPIAEWRPLPDLLGMLTQIDNASTVARELKSHALASGSKLREIEAETREACAKIAERTTVSANGHPQIDAPTPGDMRAAIATAIRSASERKT